MFLYYKHRKSILPVGRIKQHEFQRHLSVAGLLLLVDRSLCAISVISGHKCFKLGILNHILKQAQSALA